MSKIYVAKFGGSSVATISRIKHVSEIVSRLLQNRDKVVVVTSAMQGATNQLIDLIKNFEDSPINREYDNIVSTGENVAAALLATSLKSIGIESKSLNCWQIPIKVKGIYSNAFIDSVNRTKIMDMLNRNITPVITGFQGISDDYEIMTIGRGGSDASACAISYAINADECLIYTDVDGVYSADPRIVLDSKRLSQISYDDMLELASNGSKVLQSRSVLIAKQCNIKLKVVSSFNTNIKGGTIVSNQTIYIPRDKNIAGIAHNTNYTKVTINVNDNKNILDLIYKINKPEFINISKDSLSFLFPKTEISEIRKILDDSKYEFEFDNDIGMVSIVGSGIKTDDYILKETLLKLSENEIKIKQVIVSEISISIIVNLLQTENVVNILHDHFF